MWLADLFMPGHEDRFLSLLARQADILAEVATKFRAYVNNGNPSLSDDIDQLERQADDVLRDLTNALRDAFVTPIDRQDIYNLGESIDDMIDYLNNAAREITIFHVQSTDHMRAIAEILEHAASCIAVAVKSLKVNSQQAWAQARDAQHAENLVEDRYRMALSELFDGSDISTILKLREVYRHLSNSADRAEAIARVIGKIVVKSGG